MDELSTPATTIGTFLLEMKQNIDQLRYHTNGVRQSYVDDGYTLDQAGTMAAADHCWLVELMITGLRNNENTQGKS